MTLELQRRLEEAQRHALYAELYAALAVFHRLYLRAEPDVVTARARACETDAARCRAFAIAAVFGPLEPTDDD